MDILHFFFGFLTFKTLSWTHEYINKYLFLDFKTKIMTIFMWNSLSMEGFDVDPFITQDIEFEFMANKRSTKVPWK